MNLFEYCEKYKISLSKARKQMKDGVLRLDETTSEEAAEIRHWLSRGQTLTAEMLCNLVEEPAILIDLGRYAHRAREQIEALGDAKGQAAPKEVAAYIEDAARGDQDAALVLVEWIKQILPARRVGHSWIATRLLLGLPVNMRKADSKRIPRAILECRKQEEFAGWWTLETRGTKNFTHYARPKQKPVANFDL